MIDWQRRPEFVTLMHCITICQIAAVADDSAVADQTALRIGGRSRGIEDQSDRLRVGVVDTAVDLRFVDGGAAIERFRLRQQPGLARVVDTDDLAQPWRLGQGQHRGVGLPGERRQRLMQASGEIEAVGDLAGGGKHHEVGILHQVSQFAWLVPRIDRDRDRAGHGDAE